MIFPIGTGGSILPFLFLMFFVVPAVMRMLAGLAGGASQVLTHDDGGQTRQPVRSLPMYDAKAAFANAKRDFPGQLIDFDSKLGEAEEFGVNLNAGELKSARDHLNKAFASYAQYFQGDAPVTNDVAGSVKAVSSNLEAANRHLLLADPNTAAEVAAMDEKLRLAEVEAGRAAAARAKAQAEADEAAQVYGHDLFGYRMARPVATQRRSSVQVTPFGIMISSF